LAVGEIRPGPRRGLSSATTPFYDPTIGKLKLTSSSIYGQPKEAVRKANPIIPLPIVLAVWTSLMALKAGDKWPAVLARAAPMTPPKAPMKAGRGRLPTGHLPSERRSELDDYVCDFFKFA
jgi:hypothetical protein